MDNDVQLSVKAKIEYDQMTKHQEDIDEFNNLSSKNIGIKDIFQVFVPFILLLVASQFVNIDSETLNVMYIIFFASAIVQGMVSAESKKVNRRMDLLLKILKKERE
jgi:hypothetical protein